MLMVVVVFTIVMTIATIVLFVQNARLKDQVALIKLIDLNTKSLLAIIDMKALKAVSASSALLKVLGIPREEISKHDIREIIHPDDMKLLHTSVSAALEKERKGYPIENAFDSLRIRLRDVNYGWQWYELYGFFTNYNSRRLLCCSYFPVNEQMRLSANVVEIRRKMGILLNNSFNIVWEMNCLTRQLVLISPITRERFGIDDREAGPILSNEDFFPEEDIRYFREMLNRRIAALADSEQMNDEPQIHKIHVKNRDGSVVEMLTRSTLEKDDVGQYTLYGVSQRIQNNGFH
jgi:PAS domain-containing protein